MIITMKLNFNKLLSCAGKCHTSYVCYESQNNIKVKEEREKLSMHSNFRLENLKKRDHLEIDWRVM